MHDKIINESKALCFDRKLLPVESVYHLRNRYRKSRDYSINLEIAQNSKIYRYPKFDHSIMQIAYTNEFVKVRNLNDIVREFP